MQNACERRARAQVGGDARVRRLQCSGRERPTVRHKLRLHPTKRRGQARARRPHDEEAVQLVDEAEQNVSWRAVQDLLSFIDLDALSTVLMSEYSLGP